MCCLFRYVCYDCACLRDGEDVVAEDVGEDLLRREEGLCIYIYIYIYTHIIYTHMFASLSLSLSVSLYMYIYILYIYIHT